MTGCEPIASTKRLLDTGADDARDDHDVLKRHQNSDDTLLMAQEPSSGSGVKRSNLEAIRRADAEAENSVRTMKEMVQLSAKMQFSRWALRSSRTANIIFDRSCWCHTVSGS